MRKLFTLAFPAAFVIVGCSAAPACNDGGVAVFHHHTVTHHVIVHHVVTHRTRVSLLKRR